MMLQRTLLTGVAAVLLATGAAHAQTWDCSDVRIKLRKHAVHLYELTIEGRFHVAPLRANVKELRLNGKLTFNGERCRPCKENEEEEK
jgi:hypothetical protein